MSPHNPLTHSNQLQLVMWRVVTQSCAKVCVTSISPCKHAHPDSLVCRVVNKLLFKVNRGSSGKITTVPYFIIFFRFVRNWHVNNYKNIVRFVVSVSQYKCQLTLIFKRGKRKHKPITEKKTKKSRHGSYAASWINLMNKRKKETLTKATCCSYSAVQYQHSGCTVSTYCSCIAASIMKKK